MKTLQELAEAYAQREDLHTEDGEYTKTTIVDAYKAGALETLKTTILVLAMQSRVNIDAQMLYTIGSLDTNLRDCCNKITEEQILENESQKVKVKQPRNGEVEAVLRYWREHNWLYCCSSNQRLYRKLKMGDKKEALVYSIILD